MNDELKPGYIMTDESTEDEGLNSPDSPPSYVPIDFPLLTQSQEMHLFADQVVGDMVQIFGNHVWEEDASAQQTSNVPPTFNSIHPPMPSLVSNDNYAGPFEFQPYITSQTGHKNPFVYSEGLNKLFIGISTAFPIDFKCKWPVKNLFIRATPIFSLAQHSQDLVTRCLQHVTSTDSNNKNMPEYMWNHVLRCQNSNAIYYGSVDENIRLSVVVPLETPQTGSDCVRVLYMFVCKNSCPSGMNRRPIEVVFTLEDEDAHVYGRHILNVRICSCPKRDKEKEEKIHTKEDTNSVPTNKKKKVVENNKSAHEEYPIDTKEYSLTVNVCGKHNLPLVLKYCHNLMAGDLIEHGPNKNIEKCINRLAEKRKHSE